MSSNLVIVAIPAKDEKVWKVSSEQVPHLTLLLLGENTADVAKLEQIVEFVDHAVKVEEHGPVMLSVDERGTLGPDEADVLFFEKDYSIKWLSHFRNQLLQQNDIRSAYESVPQYPEWRPHLTLGYPATPAHEDEIPDHGLNWISFDRIAVWTEDFNGPEFKLRWPDRSQEEPCMAMASTNDQRKALGLDALVKELEIPVEHHGVKGMRWGVRKEQVSSGARSVGKTLAKGAKGVASSPAGQTVAKKAAAANVKQKDLRFHTKSNSGRNLNFLVNVAADRTKTHDLPAINAKYAGKAKTSNIMKLHSLSRVPVQKAYTKEVQKAYLKNLEKVANEQTNASGNKQYTIQSKSATRWHVTVRDIQHADTQILLDITYDDNGYITDIRQVDDTTMAQPNDPAAIAQSVSELGAEFIKHYGIKGMHWGIRSRQGTRSTPMPVAPKATSKVPAGDKRKTKVVVEGGHNHAAHPDAIKVAEAKAKLKKSGTASLSNQELRDVANRVQLENQVKLLTGRKGKQFVTRQLQNEGSNLARAGVRTGVKRGVQKVGLAALA